MLARPDLLRFSKRLPFVLLAAAAAELSGAIGTNAVREGLGINGVSTALAERLLFLLVATLPATAILSWAFVGRIWSAREAVVALLSTTFSFWLGPLLYTGADATLKWGLGDRWVLVRDSEVAHDPIWAFAILLVMAPAEFYVWTTTSTARARTIYARLSKLARRASSGDLQRARAVRREMRNLRRVQTEATSPLVDSVLAWTDAWLRHPEGLEKPIFEPLAADVGREMAALYGAPIREDE